MKRIIFTVTNDLAYDQRMDRICSTLVSAGFDVLLIGRKKKNSTALASKPYRQQRIRCVFQKGPAFYAEYNIRLFFVLLFKPADLFCAIDLDTILAVYFSSRIRGIKRVYDAHEYFTQMEELISRPRIQRIWMAIEKSMIPRFPKGYTVCQSIAATFSEKYKVDYAIIRNLPRQIPAEARDHTRGRFLLYQGAVNQGRGLDKLLLAMKDISLPLVICGDGNAMDMVKKHIQTFQLEEKVTLTGMLPPGELKKYTQSALIGINPFQRQGLNQYFSLANKFFDYIQSGLPQITMNYPEYARINAEFRVALLLEDLNPEEIAAAVNNLANDPVVYELLQSECHRASQILTWENEEKTLIRFYEHIFHS